MANTINFLNPATGAVSPTAAQVAAQNEVIVDVTTDGVTVTQTITHNLGISAADLALGYPHVLYEPESLHAFDTLQLFMNPATPAKTANTVILTFSAVAARFLLTISRPHTLIR